MKPEEFLKQLNELIKTGGDALDYAAANLDEIWYSGITIKNERIAEYIGRTKVAEFYQTTCAKDVEEFMSECSTGFSGTPIDGSPFTPDDSDDYAREYWDAHHVED